MKFWDEARPRAPSGRPAWCEASQLALPDPIVAVCEASGRFQVRVMLADAATMSGHWLESGELGLTDVAKLLIDWHDGPEEALSRWFGAEAPRGGRTKGAARPPQRVMAGDVNVEDLDL